jgi:hypothetical protein
VSPRVVAATGASEALEDSHAAGREAAAMALAGVGDVAPSPGRAVALLFVSIAFDLAEVLRGVREVLGVPVVGCTTYSEATERGFCDDSVAVMLLCGDGLRVGYAVSESLADDVGGAVSRAWAAAAAMLGEAPRLALAFPDAALVNEGERVVDALAAVSGGAVPIAGGAPGDGGRFRKTWQAVDDRVYSGSLPLVLLGGDFDAHVITRTGWSPIGEPITVTRASGNRVSRVGNVPVVDYVNRYTASLDPAVLGTYPLGLIDETATSGGVSHYVIRSPFFYDAAHDALVLGGVVREGARVQLGRNSRDDVLASADDAATALRAAAGGRAPAAVFFASCGARRLMLGHMTGREPETIVERLGAAVPLAGFYSYGEIGAFDSRDPALSALRYHNCTLVLCALVPRG